MQRILSLARYAFTRPPVNDLRTTLVANFSIFHKVRETILPTSVPSLNLICNLKVKGKVRRRCKSCYMVRREERLYVMCAEHPRHKQVQRAPKPLNTWILTHASQSKIRPW